LSEQAAVKRPTKTPQAHVLLAAACRIVGDEGLAGLTLRPLAEMLGVSVTVLTKNYGARADIIATICRAACEQEAPLFDDWRKTLAVLKVVPPVIAADLAESILEELATRQRALSMLYLEILHACTWDESLRPGFAEWAQQRRAFWDEFAERAGLPKVLRDCAWWHGYVIAELAYGVALNAVSSYRMVRRLCLRRLFAGGLAAEADAVDGVLFDLLREQMRYKGDGLAALVSGRTSEWSARAARACGIQLSAQGINGLTHRAIAAQIGIPHTTLSYRFPTQHDLVIAGLESIAAHILSAVDAESLTELQRLRTEDDCKKLDLARANFAMAIAATRMPQLESYTLAMRSRRGNNLVKVFAKYIPDARGIDALCAQVISMGLTGLTNTEPPGDASDQSVAAAFTATARWLAKNSAAQGGA
jgi:AcrR family transcriptional regulator